MPIFRKNLITNDWVMFSPERKSRPSDYVKPTEDNRVEAFLKRPEKDDKCPFCIGNEKKDDKEILRYVPEGREKDDWQVRILENKYASLDRAKTPDKNFSLSCSPRPISHQTYPSVEFPPPEKWGRTRGQARGRKPRLGWFISS